MNLLTFQPNTPQILSLQSSERYPLRKKGFFFELPGDQWIFLEPAAAESLTALKLQPGETFGICHKVPKGGKSYWDVWLTPETEQRRAVKEIHEETGADLTPLLVASIRNEEKKQNRVILPMPETSPEKSVLRPTGTEGAPLPVPVCGKRKGGPFPPQSLPFNIAFREVLRFTIDGLREAGEQWNDQAKQDLVSTILIAAVKQGHISLWEREGE